MQDPTSVACESKPQHSSQKAQQKMAATRPRSPNASGKSSTMSEEDDWSTVRIRPSAATVQRTAKQPEPTAARVSAAADPTFRILSDIAKELSKGEIAFPTFVSATSKIRNALDNPNLDTERLARVIGSEPLLATRLVHTANSAAMNPSGREIGDVATAVSRIGLQSVKAISTAIAISQMRSAPSMRAQIPRALRAWNHCVQVAATSFVLAQRLTRLRPDEALFAGLVHDIGYFYLLSIIDRYPELTGNEPEIDSVLAQWHEQIGQAILQSFKLSDETLQAVAEHESGRFEWPLHSLTDVVAAANRACATTNPIGANATDGADHPHDSNIRETLAESADELKSLVVALRA